MVNSQGCTFRNCFFSDNFELEVITEAGESCKVGLFITLSAAEDKTLRGDLNEGEDVDRVSIFWLELDLIFFRTKRM